MLRLRQGLDPVRPKGCLRVGIVLETAAVGGLPALHSNALKEQVMIFGLEPVSVLFVVLLDIVIAVLVKKFA